MMIWTCEKEIVDALVRKCEGLVIEGTRRGKGRLKKYGRGDKARYDATLGY